MPMYTAASPGNLFPTPAGGGTMARCASRLQCTTGSAGNGAARSPVGLPTRIAAERRTKTRVVLDRIGPPLRALYLPGLPGNLSGGPPAGLVELVGNPDRKSTRL